MTSAKRFEELYEEWIERPTLAYRHSVGVAVDLSAEALGQFVQNLHRWRAESPYLAGWLLFDYKTFQVTARDGDADIFGIPISSKRDLLARVHPHYFLPYLRWLKAMYGVLFRHPEKMQQPLLHTFRISLPLRTGTNRYWWFSTDSIVAQLDAEHRIATVLKVFYQENEWSGFSLRPVEANIFSRTEGAEGINQELSAQLSLQLAELFTDAELDLIALYAKGKPTEAILKVKKWSRHTLHEYNTHLLRKSRELFVYDFKNARQFAEYCRERRIFQFKI